MPRLTIVTLVTGSHFGKHALHDGVAALVVGDDLLLLLGDDAAPALRSGDHAVDRLVELGHADGLLVAARGQDGGLVDEVREIGAREAGRATRERLDVDRLVERLALDVDLQDLAGGP